MKKIGIVGLGLKNPYTYAPILKEKGARVVAVFDTYPELVKEYANLFNCTEVEDIKDYPPVDGVIIDSINNQHIALATYFLERGIPVFIDKPLSHNVDDALFFIDTNKGKPWFSASPLRFSPVYNQMAQDIRTDGNALQYCRVSVFHTMEHFMQDPKKAWHDDPELGGGMLIDIGIHAIELLNMMIPDKTIASISYTKDASYYKTSHSKDNHHITLRYEDGICASIDLLCATSHLDYTVDAYTLTKKYSNLNEIPYLKGDWTAGNAYGGFEKTIEVFLEMVKTGHPPISDDETKRNFLLLEKIIQQGDSIYE